jgi:hypothetical protein
MLRLDAFGLDRSKPHGHGYRCLECDRAKSAARYRTPDAARVRALRNAVLAAAGRRCWCCGTDESLAPFGPGGARLSLAELEEIVAELGWGELEDVIDAHGVLVACPACAARTGEQLLAEITARLDAALGLEDPPSAAPGGPDGPDAPIPLTRRRTGRFSGFPAGNRTRFPRD